jgi:7-cyano-7-deazaguanine synthase
VWVPNRNGVLINTAAAFAERLGAERVVVGFNREEAATFPDNSADYLERASRALELSTATQARVFCYTIDWDKSTIVRRLREEIADFPFDLLWSCYEGGTVRCGVCESCRRLERALTC